MRPIRLDVKGFTSFRDAQSIDFADLDLFAIVGPTGSGKSSLLDAMTYALFGEVDRVGRGVGQLISQGQARMAVTFEFAVASDRYRVTRSTGGARSGQTRVLLEVRDGQEWRQAGEGADRVREVNARLERTIGLDYDAFTRSVLLPQGRFADFLVGDAGDRRSILTELLGLELFTRLAKRAGEARATSASAATAKAELLDAQFAGVDAESVADAERRAVEAGKREASLRSIAVAVDDIARRAARIASEERELAACVHDARAFAVTIRDVGSALRELAPRVEAASSEARAAAEGADELAAAAAGAVKARTAAEREHGRASDLAALRGRVESIERLDADIRSTSDELERIQAEIERAGAAVQAARESAAAAEDAQDRARHALAAARASLDAAQHANLVAAVRAGASPGEPCPVCGAPVGELAAASGAVDLDDARAAVAGAERSLEDASKALRGAERGRDRAEAVAAESERTRARLRSELRRRRAERARAAAEVGKVLGEDGIDAIAVVDERIRRLEELQRVERTATAASAAAERLRSDAERARSSIEARVVEARSRLSPSTLEGILVRAERLEGIDVDGASIPTLAIANDAPALAECATALHVAAADIVTRLDAAAADRERAATTMLAEALAVLDGLLDPGDVVENSGGAATAIERLREAIATAERDAARDAATAREQAARLAERLEASRALAHDVESLRRRAERFGALARELRADNIIEFLQLEALQLLAAGGSERLATLSDGRYRLAFEADEFYVVDVWNGEEMRSARTLSGGETFLASLALALALSEGVQALAVTERARLESLFLDEGFGALDPETLETVVGAIEQLGGDGRMVGVITHVQELAIRLPARIEVEKAPRGSRLRVVA
jgi:DNA repair protein SbcC/Rad50